MTIPQWPSTLPRPTRASYAATAPDGRLSTKMEAGPPRVRRRYSSAAATRQMAIVATGDQRARFWRFWGEDTVGGSLPFFVPDWTRDGVALTTETGAVLTLADGTPILIAATQLALFGTEQPPSEAMVGVEFRITFQLMIMP